MPHSAATVIPESLVSLSKRPHARARHKQHRRSFQAEQYTIRIESLEVMCHIGLRAGEYGQRQIVRIDLDIELDPALLPADDSADPPLCYSELSTAVRQCAEESPHIRLLETLAQNIAELCFALPATRRLAVSLTKPATEAGEARVIDFVFASL